MSRRLVAPMTNTVLFVKSIPFSDKSLHDVIGKAIAAGAAAFDKYAFAFVNKKDAAFISFGFFPYFFDFLPAFTNVTPFQVVQVYRNKAAIQGIGEGAGDE